MEISVQDAADVIGVSDRRVRQLIAAGRVRARSVGGRWLVDSTSLPTAPRRTRPMTVAGAWAFLLLEHPGASDHPTRWRERRARLTADAEPGALLASWTATRAQRLLFTTREPHGVLVDPRVVRSGVSDPRSGISAADLAEGYVTSADLAAVRRAHLLRPATGPADVVLHVVDDLPPSPVPLLVLAADLAEHERPRELERAGTLIEQAVAAA